MYSSDTPTKTTYPLREILSPHGTSRTPYDLSAPSALVRQPHTVYLGKREPPASWAPPTCSDDDYCHPARVPQPLQDAPRAVPEGI